MIDLLTAHGTIRFARLSFIVDQDTDKGGKRQRVSAVAHDKLALVQASGEQGEDDGTFRRDFHRGDGQEGLGRRSRGDLFD